MLAFAMVCAIGARSAAAATTSDDYIARAIQLLRGLYPELKNVCPTIVDEIELNNRSAAHPDVVSTFTVSLRYCHLHPLDPRLQQRFGALLAARFDFIPAYNFTKILWVWGPIVRERLEKIEAEVQKHPGWSDAEIVQALKSAGAKFGPGDRAEFIRSLPLKQLEPVTGRLHVVSADLGVRYRPPVLTWRVEAKWQSDDGRHEADCLLFFEPLEGQLIDFSLRSEIRPAQ